MSFVPDGFLTSESDSEPDLVFSHSKLDEVFYLKDILYDKLAT